MELDRSWYTCDARQIVSLLEFRRGTSSPANWGSCFIRGKPLVESTAASPSRTGEDPYVKSWRFAS